MNTIESVVITGFWSDETISLDFKKSVNFLIGRNGSGKTTVINLIAASLSADFENLDRMAFESITIKLAEVGGRKKPSVTIKKTDNKVPPFPGIQYSIKESAGSKPIEFSLDDFEEQILYRNYRLSMSRELRRIRGNSILEQLESLIRVSWLSVHRHSNKSRREERSWESSIDRKLEQLSNSFVRFFSQLSEKTTTLLEEFQKTVFLSLLSDQSDNQITSQLQKLDVVEERKALEDIYKQFNLKPNQFQKRTSKHFEGLESALTKFEQNGPMTLTDLAALTGTVRIHSVVEAWSDLVSRRKKLFEPRDTFLNILNALVVKKRFFINPKNELSVETKSRKVFPLTQLSSGEKQLLIVLGEALLQEQQPWIYIADEPELSLHVAWQESLVRNLKAVNPNAQILFATHSPDIVSTFTSSVINMEKALK